MMNEVLTALTTLVNRARNIRQEMAEAELAGFRDSKAAIVFRLQPFDPNERAIKMMMKIPDPQVGDH